MKITKLIAAVGMLLGMTACDTDKEIAIYGQDPAAIKIDATIGGVYTRSNPLADGDGQKQFNEGDRIQLVCEDGNMTFELTDGSWTPTDYNYLRWGNEPLTYAAFYPVVSGASMQNFTLPTNQQKAETMAEADYMTCTVADAVNDGSNVLHLCMNRRMAKVIMKLADVGNQNKANGVKIGSYSGYTAGQVNNATSLVTPLITAPAGGKAGQNGTTYTAIVVPGEAKADATFISLNYLGEDLVMLGIPALEAGQCYEFTFRVEGSIIQVDEPIVTPWVEGTLKGGDVSELLLDAYYVKEQACGNGTGMDWDNAMGADAFRSLIRTNSDASVTAANAAKLDGKTIYVAGGDYLIVQDNAGVKVEYSGYEKQVQIVVKGGFDPASTGTDLSRRDIGKYVTTFCGNTNCEATDTEASMFTFGNQIDMYFNGCTFDGKHESSDTGYTRCLQAYAGNSGDATVRLTDCIVKNCNSVGKGNDGGGAIRVGKALVCLDNVTFFNNTAANRGGAINTANAACYLFMNNCTLYDNYASAAWGTAIQGGSGYICINNSTILGTPGTSKNSITMNGDAYWLLANTTVISNSGNPYGAFRAGGSGKNAVLVNSLFSKGAGTRTIYAGNITSGGYNVCQAADSDWGATTTDTDYSDIVLPEAKLTDGVYQWTVTEEVMNGFATKQAVIDAVKSFPAGQMFIDWLGENAFGVDQRGVTRNSDKMQPGAYDAVLR